MSGTQFPRISEKYTYYFAHIYNSDNVYLYHYLPMRPVVILSGDTNAFTKDYIIEKMCEDVSSLYWRGANELYDPNAVFKYYEKDGDGQWYYIGYKGKQVLTEEEWNKKISELYDIENKKFKCNNMYYQKDEDGWYWISSSKNEKIYAGVEEEGIRKILDDFTEIVLVN